jgi:hypothetical protein
MAAIAVRLLRLASIVICLIVIASFAAFAIDQTKGASSEQTEQLSSEVPGAKPADAKPAPGTVAHESSARKTLDEASNKLTSPFNGITSGFSSEWASRGVKLLLALVVYGFAVGYVVRFLSVRV